MPNGHLLNRLITYKGETDGIVCACCYLPRPLCSLRLLHLRRLCRRARVPLGGLAESLESNGRRARASDARAGAAVLAVPLLRHPRRRPPHLRAARRPRGESRVEWPPRESERCEGRRSCTGRAPLLRHPRRRPPHLRAARWACGESRVEWPPCKRQTNARERAARGRGRRGRRVGSVERTGAGYGERGLFVWLTGGAPGLRAVLHLHEASPTRACFTLRHGAGLAVFSLRSICHTPALSTCCGAYTALRCPPSPALSHAHACL